VSCLCSPPARARLTGGPAVITGGGVCRRAEWPDRTADAGCRVRGVGLARATRNRGRFNRVGSDHDRRRRRGSPKPPRARRQSENGSGTGAGRKPTSQSSPLSPSPRNADPVREARKSTQQALYPLRIRPCSASGIRPLSAHGAARLRLVCLLRFGVFPFILELALAHSSRHGGYPQDNPYRDRS